MKRISIATTVVLSLLVAIVVVSNTRAQEPRTDDVPKAALLTKRGAELADRLKWLRRSEASMGRNHPLLPEVRAQIKGVQEQLKAWAPAPNENTFEAFDLKRRVPQMNEEDLRQLVVQLAEQVTELNERVTRLERR